MCSRKIKAEQAPGLLFNFRHDMAQHLEQSSFTALVIGSSGTPQLVALVVNQQRKNVLFILHVQGGPKIILFQVKRNGALA